MTEVEVTNRHVMKKKKKPTPILPDVKLLWIQRKPFWQTGCTNVWGDCGGCDKSHCEYIAMGRKRSPTGWFVSRKK